MLECKLCHDEIKQTKIAKGRSGIKPKGETTDREIQGFKKQDFTTF
jgi:hypothetical protein